MQTRKLDFSSTYCMAMLTGIGGFINAYTTVRWSFMATMNSGNMTRLGAAIADNWGTLSWGCLSPFAVPILGSIFGSFIGALIAGKAKHFYCKSYQAMILALEFLGFFALGFMSTDASVNLMLAWVSTLGGMQLYGFRKWGNVAHNTTISSGNLRSVGEFWGNFCNEPSKDSLLFAVKYTFMAATWPLGAIVGATTGAIWGGPAAWICALSVATILLESHLRSGKEPCNVK